MIPESKSNIQQPKTDRRILRTRRSLRNALLNLIKEKDFDSISVEEITDRADLGRATFYLHYKDKEDLLLEEFREIARNRVQVLSEIPLSIWRLNQGNLDIVNGNSPIMPLLLVFEHASQNANLYRILLKGKNSQSIAVQMREIIVKAINEIIQTQTEGKAVSEPIPVELLAAYFSGAMMSSINWWLEQENPPQPDQMARMFQHLFFPGVLQLWGRYQNP
jgi:AcrR family transcriptional regulator